MHELSISIFWGSKIWRLIIFFSKTWNKVSIHYIFILTYIHHRYCKALTDYSFSFYNFPILFIFVISSFFFLASQRNKKILLTSQWLIPLHFCFPSTSRYDLTSGTNFFFLLLKNKIKHKGLLHPKKRHITLWTENLYFTCFELEFKDANSAIPHSFSPHLRKTQRTAWHSHIKLPQKMQRLEGQTRNHAQRELVRDEYSRCW